MIDSSVVFFPCINIEETKAYYLDVLGLKIFKDMGNCVIFDTNYGYIGMTEYGDGRPLSTSFCLSFNLSSCEEVDEMYALVKARGAISLQKPPEKHPVFSVYSFFLSDPNGYMLEFQKILG